MRYEGVWFNMKVVLGYDNAEAFAEAPQYRQLWDHEKKVTPEIRHKRLIDFFNLATNADSTKLPAVSQSATDTESTGGGSGVDVS